jgi:hypothetical protein
VFAQIAGGDEYYALHLSNPTQFVRALYQDLLNRGASDTEVLTWLNKLNSGESRAQVVADFTSTQEYQQVAVTSLFTTYLRRPPSSQEMSQYVTQMQTGGSDAALAAQVLGGAEYFGSNVV